MDTRRPLSQTALIEQNAALVPFTLGPLLRRAGVLSDADKDDVLGAGYLALCRAAQTYKQGRGGAFSTWACACIRNAGLDALKRCETYRARKEGYAVASLDAPLVGGAELSPLVDLLADETAGAGFAAVLARANRRALWAWALPLLTAKQGRALWLFAGEGLSYEDAAGVLGIQPQTVKTTVYAATMKLRAAVVAKPPPFTLPN